MEPVERVIALYPELRVAVKQWGDPNSVKRVLASHGWMDNAATWDLVAPVLASSGFLVACVDLPGHGQSDHLPPSAGPAYNAMGYAAALVQTAEALWGPESRFIIMGHSMSAGLAAIVAGAFPDRVAALVMVEGLGPSYRSTDDAVKHFREGMGTLRLGGRGMSGSSGSGSVGSAYPSKDTAVDARLATVARYPGAQYLSRDAAARLVDRALAEVKGEEGASKWRFRHDRRIVGPAVLSPSDAHARTFLAAIRSPTLLVTATKGWPWPQEVMQGRLDVLGNALQAAAQEADASGVPASCRAALSHQRLTGGHHLHVDPETAQETAGTLCSFLLSAPVSHSLTRPE